MRIACGLIARRPPFRLSEIFSYILSGGLEHKDSMGNVEILERGHVQFTSAGTGISHSEFNADKRRGGKPVRFLQIWCLPSARGLKPSYQTGLFPDAAKTDAFATLIEPAATPVRTPGVIGINNEAVSMRACILSAGAEVTLPRGAAREAYVHVPIMPGAVGVEIVPSRGEPVSLAPGDGAFVRAIEGELRFVGLAAAAVAGADGAAALAPAPAKTEFVVLSWT